MMAAPVIEEGVFEAAMATPVSSRITSAQSDILAPAPVALLPPLSVVALYPLSVLTTSPIHAKPSQEKLQP
jgi:hypothetical protein